MNSLIYSLVVTIGALVVNANAVSPALEDANQPKLKPNIISEVYIVAQTLPTIEVVWEYPKLPVKLFEADNGQCVNYAETLSGINLEGNAIDWIDDVNALEPSLGAVAIFSYGHGAVVWKINYIEKTVWIVERNYYGKWIVNERELSWDDETIVGYHIKTQVKPE